MTSALALPDMIGSFDDLMRFAELLVKSKMIPATVGTKEAAAAIILKGRELGMPMMESFSQINVIQGKPTISPQCMIALARRTGELEYLTIKHNAENTATTVFVKRKGEPEHPTTFSDEDAIAMGLFSKDNWRKQKAVMRQWRAVSANFRVTFADKIGGMYPPEELGADVDEDGEVIQPVKTVESNVVPLTEIISTPRPEPVTAKSEPYHEEIDDVVNAAIAHNENATGKVDWDKVRAEAKPKIDAINKTASVGAMPTQPPKTEAKPAVKRALIKTGKWQVTIKRAVDAGYVPNDNSTAFRLAQVVGNAGIAEVTDANAETEVWYAISKHYEDERALAGMPQEETEPAVA